VATADLADRRLPRAPGISDLLLRAVDPAANTCSGIGPSVISEFRVLIDRDPVVRMCVRRSSLAGDVATPLGASLDWTWGQRPGSRPIGTRGSTRCSRRSWPSSASSSAAATRSCPQRLAVGLEVRRGGARSRSIVRAKRSSRKTQTSLQTARDGAQQTPPGSKATQTQKRLEPECCRVGAPASNPPGEPIYRPAWVSTTRSSRASMRSRATSPSRRLTEVGRSGAALLVGQSGHPAA
jgi:hypothetical protein